MAASISDPTHMLSEFVAHSQKVNCLQLGRNSGQVLATGGEDKRVNLWRVGRPGNILSMPGHQSPVESVRFDNKEQTVAAGSKGGSIKLFDLLAEGKVSRTLTGHRSEW